MKTDQLKRLIKEMLNELDMEDRSNESESQNLFDEGFSKIQEGLGMMMTATNMLDSDMADAMMQFIGKELSPAFNVMMQSYSQAKEESKKSNLIQGPWKS